ncbi:MAG: tRNA (guanosine(46)-N7)-methyltransferase TrmB [Gammaproteobacteria bacterium]|nr:tRNA (guanosine(46)-N7)-methyltransferase TrmB [Gammaproteobacteria bacterium]
MSKPEYLRKIRSFVRREGRLTTGQQHALDTLWPKYGIDISDTTLDLGSIFGNEKPVILEIGFGNGDSLAQMAKDNPGLNYLGIEVHRPGVGHLLYLIEEQGIENLRIMSEDAVEIISNQIPEQALTGIQLFFPDPWPKKKHHKRRIVQPEFVKLLASRLKPGGFFHMATDWENYAEHMLEVMSAAEDFENSTQGGDFIPRPESRPLTKFEQRGQRLGHGVWDLLYIRK